MPETDIKVENVGKTRAKKHFEIRIAKYGFQHDFEVIHKTHKCTCTHIYPQTCTPPVKGEYMEKNGQKTISDSSGCVMKNKIGYRRWI